MDTKTKILHEAMIMFLQKGFDKTSMNDIVEAAQITKGGIYHYFTNKRELVIQSMGYLNQRLAEWGFTILSENASIYDILHAHFGTSANIGDFLEQLAPGRNLSAERWFTILFQGIIDYPEIRTMMNHMHHELHAMLTNELTKAQQQGEIRADLDCAEFALEVHSLMDGVFAYCIFDDTYPLQETMMHVFHNVWNRIKA
jgi:AcrR family transcriptional regulator